MDLIYFRDKLFDAVNDGEGLEIADLYADERKGLLIARTEDGSVFEIECRQAVGKKDE